MRDRWQFSLSASGTSAGLPGDPRLPERVSPVAVTGFSYSDGRALADPGPVSVHLEDFSKESVMPLDEYTISLIKGKNLGIIVTLMPDGQPQALPTWIDTDGEHLLVNTERERQRSKNIARDPRVTVLVMSSESPWDWSELRGRVVGMTDGDEALRHIHELSNKYVDKDYTREIGPTGRIIFKIAADKILTPAMLGYA